MFLQAPFLLSVAALAGLATRPWRIWPGAGLLYVLVLQALVVSPLLVPIVASPDRVTLEVLPLLCVLATIVAWQPLRARRAVVQLAGLALTAYCFMQLYWPGSSHPGRSGRWRAAFIGTPPEIAALERLKLSPTTVVLTPRPFKAAMLADVAAVIVPNDGVAGLRAVIQRYRPRFALVAARSGLERSLRSVEHGKLRQRARAGRWIWYELDVSPGGR